MPHKRAKKSLRDAATASAGYDNPPTFADAAPSTSTSTSNSMTNGAGVWAPKDKEEGKMKRRQAEKTGKRPKTDSFGGRNDLGGLSKNLYRVLNAGALREEYNANKKRKREEEEQGGSKKKSALMAKEAKNMKPLPYESLSTFNKRVEVALRPAVDSAMKSARTVTPSKKSKVAAAKAAALAAKEEEAEEAAPTSKSSKKKAPPVDPFIPKPHLVGRSTEFAVASQKRSIADVVMAPPELTVGSKSGKGSAKAASSRLPISEDVKRIMEMEREKAVRLYREMKEGKASAK